MQETQLGVVEFENRKKKYVYDFNVLTIEQVELAREVAEYKLDQNTMKAENVEQIINSGAADWMSKIMSFLLLEETEGELMPFVRSRAADTEQFVKTLPAKEHSRIKECCDDFFTSIGKPKLISWLLHDENSRRTEQLLPLLMTVLKGTNNG